MNYLEELKKMIAEDFEAKEVKSKEDVDKYSNMSKYLDNAIADNKKLVDANAELSKCYTELAMHTTIGEKKDAGDTPTQHAPNFEEMLAQYSQKGDNK